MIGPRPALTHYPKRAAPEFPLCATKTLFDSAIVDKLKDQPPPPTTNRPPVTFFESLPLDNRCNTESNMSDHGEVEVENPSAVYTMLPKDALSEMGTVKLFNKWSYDDVEIRDISLT